MLNIDKRMCYPVAQDTLQLALETVDNLFSLPESKDLAYKIIHIYIFNEKLKEGIEVIDEAEIEQRFCQLLKDYLLDKLTRGGLVDVSFDDEVNDFVFNLSEKGKQLFGPLSQNMEKMFNKLKEDRGQDFNV